MKFYLLSHNVNKLFYEVCLHCGDLRNSIGRTFDKYKRWTNRISENKDNHCATSLSAITIIKSAILEKMQPACQFSTFLFPLSSISDIVWQQQMTWKWPTQSGVLLDPLKSDLVWPTTILFGRFLAEVQIRALARGLLWVLGSSSYTHTNIFYSGRGSPNVKSLLTSTPLYKGWGRQNDTIIQVGIHIQSV